MQRQIPTVKKVDILRDHLENDVPLSELAERYHVNVNSIMNWKKRLFESAPDVFSKRAERTTKDQKTEVEPVGGTFLRARPLDRVVEV